MTSDVPPASQDIPVWMNVWDAWTRGTIVIELYPFVTGDPQPIYTGIVIYCIMVSINQSNEPRASKTTLRGILQKIGSSVLLMIAVAGVLTVLTGYVIQTGVWAAILAVWGTALVIVGVVGYTAIWWDRR